jgi:hypothetical protein
MPQMDDAHHLLLGLKTNYRATASPAAAAAAGQKKTVEPTSKKSHYSGHHYPTSWRPSRVLQNASHCLNNTSKHRQQQSRAKKPRQQTKQVSSSSSLRPAPLVQPASKQHPAVPATYPRRLGLPNDSVKLNQLHCFVREQLLEIFVVEPRGSSSSSAAEGVTASGTSVGRVGLRCFFCALNRRTDASYRAETEAPMAVFYPKRVAEIYRLVTSWQRCHVRKCRSMPPAVRGRWEELRRSEKCRGKTAYWTDAAHEIGLIDCRHQTGVRFQVAAAAAATTEEEDATTTTTASSPARQESLALRAADEENAAPPSESVSSSS